MHLAAVWETTGRRLWLAATMLPAQHGGAATDGPAATMPVSVVIPAYNREQMVVRAVTSALSQRPHPPAEVIVVDDCSNDGTGDAAAGVGARIVRHDHNRGEGAARNTGVSHARHEWVALLDSDDEWLPNMLATLWPLRAGHVLVGGASLNCGADPARDRYAGVVGRRPRVLGSPSALIYPENFVAASGTMVRRDVVLEVGGYTEGLKAGADMDLWIRVLERGSGLIVPQPVVLYHMHEGQVTTDPELMVRGHRAVAGKYEQRPWWSPSLLRRWEGGADYDAARKALADGRAGEALARLGHVARDPDRALGAIGLLVRRARLRRRSGLVDRQGVPTVAVFPGAGAVGPQAHDLRQVSSARALASLACRPTHAAVVGSPLQAVAARLAGVREVRRDGRPTPREDR
jgi:GT2 family glycosyltransferase